MKNLFIPENYSPIIDLKNTERALKVVKDYFEQALSAELRLKRVTAPLFVEKGTGVNDDLNGTENPVEFKVKNMDNKVAQIVHSLAKWKRMALADYNIPVNFGIYTDMNAIRPDEETSNIHSLYVDQWDWEMVISKNQRNLDTLKEIVTRLYGVLKRTEYIVHENYPNIPSILPKEITFIHSEELLEMYPDKTPAERENAFVEKVGAAFVIGIGGVLPNGKKHDGRAPDYDDWSTETEKGYKGLNGDILLWNPVLKRSFEISSMGIRVDKDALLKQLEIEGENSRKDLMWHKRLLNNQLPLSLGGGIGQSRLAMYFLRKAHIGETQASIWPKEMVLECKKNNILFM